MTLLYDLSYMRTAYMLFNTEDVLTKVSWLSLGTLRNARPLSLESRTSTLS
jgi:hypothetical protein